MLEAALLDHWWAGLLLWAGCYVSDYALTIAGARRYRDAANTHVVFEGGYELTPLFRADVAALRAVSPRFLLFLALSCGALLGYWLVSVRWLGYPQLYLVLIGAFLLVEGVVHVRHIRNLTLFRLARDPGGIRGQVTYPRGVTLRVSSAELLGFAGLFLFMSLATSSWFVVGGALGCAMQASKSQRWARAAKRE